MGIMSKYELSGNSSSRFIKGEEFEGEGLKLKVVGSEIVKANKGFGATEADYLFKEGILKDGETFRYTFIQENDEGDTERVFETKSAVFFISMKNCDPDEGEIILISRKGERQETEYDIKKGIPF